MGLAEEDVGVEAIFVLGPWAGRNDVRVRPGVHVISTPDGGGDYVYRDHAVYRDGGVAWVEYIWEFNRESQRRLRAFVEQYRDHGVD